MIEGLGVSPNLRSEARCNSRRRRGLLAEARAADVDTPLLGPLTRSASTLTR